MTDIKFIGTTQVELVNSLDESNKISPTQVGENFIEFSFNTLSKDSSDFYHFVITGSNVQVSGTIDSVTTDYQFFSLFSGCSQITDASQLQITAPTMKFFCFGNMFKDCTNLINPPSVEATTLAEWCYQGMFAGCSKMTSAPQLPATTLAPYCYYAMFYGCKALTSAPYLPASTLVDWCYNSMFYNCQSLTSISADFTNWNTSGNSTKNWVTGIDTEGRLYNESLIEIFDYDHIPYNWYVAVDLGTPLTFKSIGNNTVQLNHIANNDQFYYKKNNGEWISYQQEEIQLSNDDTLAFSGNWNNDTSLWSKKFTSSGDGLRVYGNCNSINGFSNTLTSGKNFEKLFTNCPNLIDASRLSLPTNIMPPYSTFGGYAYMFSGCTNLVYGPSVLPASSLADYSYYRMFAGCSNLVMAPKIYATRLSDRCCCEMFSGCTSLSTAPYLPATTLAQNCYNGMFKNCTSLSTAPKLPAQTLVKWCYGNMFAGCEALSSITANFTDWKDGVYATEMWLGGVAINGTFYKPSELYEIINASHIPSGWTVINK